MVNATAERHGASWRMLVELGPEIRAVGIYPGGQSGNPGSKFYGNFVEKWSKGEYIDVTHRTSDQEDGLIFTTILKPEKE